MIETVNDNSIIDNDDLIEETLKKIVETRYEASFDRSKLTPASEMHAEAKRFLEIEAEIA